MYQLITDHSYVIIINFNKLAVFLYFIEDELTLVRDIEIQNWAAELSDPESCQLKVNT